MLYKEENEKLNTDKILSNSAEITNKINASFNSEDLLSDKRLVKKPTRLALFGDEDKRDTFKNFQESLNNMNQLPKEAKEEKEELAVAQENEKKKIICLKDIDALYYDDTFKYDKRTFCQYYKDLLITEHPIISIFAKKSLFEPVWLRIIQFFHSLALNFSLNAVFYTDRYIELRAKQLMDELNTTEEVKALKVLFYFKLNLGH